MQKYTACIYNMANENTNKSQWKKQSTPYDDKLKVANVKQVMRVWDEIKHKTVQKHETAEKS